MRNLFLAAALAATSSTLAAETVQGTGSAPIGKDAGSVRAAAERGARRALVTEMLRQSIGDERLREIPATKIDALAGQIRDDMIVKRASSREGQTFLVNLQADIDGAWFSTQLGNFDIRLSSDRASGGAMIMVMLDQVEGTATDFNRPAETSFEYDRQTGASFSDRSSHATSQRDASAASSKSASGYSGAYRSASGVSTPYGSAAGAARGRAAGAAVSKSSSASVHKYDHASKSRVNAEVHDNVRVREHVIYQQPPKESDAGFVMTTLVGELMGYNVETADSFASLSSFFKGRPPRLAALPNDGRFSAFLSAMAAQNKPFFMGGKLQVSYKMDAATQGVSCGGSLDAKAYATADGRNIGAGTATGRAIAGDDTECRAKLAKLLARDTAAQIGPRVQRFWRDRTRAAGDVMRAAVDTSQDADYSLVLRSNKLSMAMQADLLDALQGTPGVKSQGFISQTGSEMRFAVRYAGDVPLQLALFQKLRRNPAFAAMQSSVQGRSVLLCLSGCPAQ